MHTNPSSRIIIWFRNDLRLLDQEAIYRASQKTSDIIPIYCFDPRHYEETYLGFPKTDSYRGQFLIESVHKLRQNLKKLGSNLLIRVGHPEEIIPDLAKHLNAEAVYCSKEVTDEEIKVEEALEAKLWNEKIVLETFWTSTLYHLEDLPYPIRNLPDVFTQFRKGVEKTIQVRKTFPKPAQLKALPSIKEGDIPSLEDIGLEAFEAHPKAVLRFEGGEDAALERMKTYFWDQNLLKSYKHTRNGLLGADYSSKFSAWLALGCISPRTIYEEVKSYESKVTKNQSTYWLIFELIWRDYFRFVARKFGNRLFHRRGIKNKLPFELRELENLFHQWKEGSTGIPFIDANMLELKHTGFMSNRGRQNVASFLVKDLKINWVWGAMYFESKLIDYDVCSNWGNWNYVAGVGNDPRENRYFNILSQAKRYDDKGAYVKHWLPELEDLPPHLVHRPADMTMKEQKRYALHVGVDYPNPIVDFDRWIA